MTFILPKESLAVRSKILIEPHMSYDSVEWEAVLRGQEINSQGNPDNFAHSTFYKA